MGHSQSPAPAACVRARRQAGARVGPGTYPRKGRSRQTCGDGRAPHLLAFYTSCFFRAGGGGGEQGGVVKQSLRYPPGEGQASPTCWVRTWREGREGRGRLRYQGAGAAQAVAHSILDCDSGHDLRVVGSSPRASSARRPPESLLLPLPLPWCTRSLSPK